MHRQATLLTQLAILLAQLVKLLTQLESARRGVVPLCSEVLLSVLEVLDWWAARGLLTYIDI